MEPGAASRPRPRRSDYEAALPEEDAEDDEALVDPLPLDPLLPDPLPLDPPLEAPARESVR